ncbi:unnamed protein product, partial [Didymodactylos carnosus]
VKNSKDLPTSSNPNASLPNNDNMMDTNQDDRDFANFPGSDCEKEEEEKEERDYEDEDIIKNDLFIKLTQQIEKNPEDQLNLSLTKWLIDLKNSHASEAE